MNTKAFLSYLYEQGKLSQDTFQQLGEVASLTNLRSELKAQGYSEKEWEQDWKDFQKKSRSKTDFFAFDSFPPTPPTPEKNSFKDTQVEIPILSWDTLQKPSTPTIPFGENDLSHTFTNSVSWNTVEVDSTPTVSFEKKIHPEPQKFQGHEIAFLHFLIEKGRLSSSELEIYSQQLTSQSPEEILKSHGMLQDEFLQYYLAFQQNLRKDTRIHSLSNEVDTTVELENDLTHSEAKINSESFEEVTFSELDQKNASSELVKTRAMDETRTQEDASSTVLSEVRRVPFPSTSLEVKTIGKYEILEKLAQGGMGVVYKVRHQELNQIYALKVILPGQEVSSEAITRFQREAKISAKLHHPHIVQILDFGKEQDQYYFCMEYVEGQTLKEFIQKKVGIRECLLFFKKTLEALDYAHSQGVVHRDIKPSNIFVTSTQDPKIVDFGIAKDLSYQATQQLTHTGQLLGTPLYMAPEQASEKSDHVTPAVDIYSIGVCLFHALTQRHPFEAETLHKLLYKVLAEEAIPPSKFNKELHRDLDVIVLKSLHKSPKKRYSSAAAFARDIGRFLNGYPIHARPITWVERSWMWIKRNKQPLLAGIFVVFVATILFFSKKWEAYHTLQKQYLGALNSAQIQISQAEKISEQSSNTITQKISYLLSALSSFNLALSLKPEDPSVELQKYTLGKTLVPLACTNAQYDLADYLITEMENLKSISTEQKQPLKKMASDAREYQLKTHQQRLNFWKEELKKKKKRFGFRERALLEISKMPEEEIFLELLDILKEGINYFIGEKVTRTAILDEYYGTFALALGQLENPKSEEPLVEALKCLLESVLKKEEQDYSSITEVSYMVILAQALEYSKAPNAAKALQEIRNASGDGSLFWKQTHSFIKICLK